MSVSTKTCPDCGASNLAGALFCEECGTSLAMTPENNQATAAFTPVYEPPVEDHTVAIAPAPQSTPVYTPSPQTATTQTYGYVPHEESVRGAVLGWIAAILFLLIVGFFVWSTLLSDATRDRFTGLF